MLVCFFAVRAVDWTFRGTFTSLFVLFHKRTPHFTPKIVNIFY